MRATRRQPAYCLTAEDAVQVWLLHWDGELNHRIAARFDTNQGRVSEVLTGKRHSDSEAAARVIWARSRSANNPEAPASL